MVVIGQTDCSCEQCRYIDALTLAILQTQTKAGTTE